MSESCPSKTWRSAAAKVVEELFPVSPQVDWDALLDLRGHLLNRGDCDGLLEAFAVCRRALEEEHYLPFYRLRRLIAAHLRLEGEAPVSLEALLRRRNFSIRRWREKRGPHRLVERV